MLIQTPKNINEMPIVFDGTYLKTKTGTLKSHFYKTVTRTKTTTY